MRYFKLNLLLFPILLTTSQWLQAATAWSGPDTLVTQLAGEPLSVTDILVPGVASLSRDGNGLLCNTLNGDSCGPFLFDNPTDFEWAFSDLNGNGFIAYGSAAGLGAGLSFDDLYNAWEQFPFGNAPGSVGVGHIISQDIYFDIEFFDWGRGGERLFFLPEVNA